MSKKLRKRGKEDLRELILDETVEERYERLKVGERTGMALRDCGQNANEKIFS